jgi:diacylglycerol kinase family enzyme
VTNVVLIVNPFSTGVKESRLEEVEAELGKVANVEVRETERPGHATAIAAQAAETADAVVVYSGDGTYNEAVNGAAGRVPFGFVPGGGASVFARALGLGRDPVAAAATIASALAGGRRRSITLGRVNGRLFTFSAGLGVDGEAVRKVDDRGRTEEGKRASNFVYALTVVRTVVEHRLRLDPQIEIEGHGRAAFLFVANGHPYTYAGRVPFTLLRDAEFEQGLHFVAPREVRPLNVPGLVMHMFRGTSADDPNVIAGVDVDGLVARCDSPLPLQADGEDLGDVTEATFVAERDALTVLA